MAAPSAGLSRNAPSAARTAAATPVASATAAVDDGGGMAASKRIRNDARGKGRLPDEAAATSASAAPTEGRPGRHGDGDGDGRLPDRFAGAAAKDAAAAMAAAGLLPGGRPAGHVGHLHGKAQEGAQQGPLSWRRRRPPPPPS